MTDRRTDPSRRRGARLLAAFTVVALTAAACGSDDDSTNTTVATTETTTGTPDSAAPGATDGPSTSDGAPESSAGGDLRWAIRVGPSNFDPHLASTTEDTRVHPLVYDRLVTYDTEGVLQPGLAESWEFSADGLAMTMKLRTGVTFDDGSPFDASVVKANIDRALTVEGSSAKNDLLSIAEVKVDDPSTVTFVLKAPNPGLPAILTGRGGGMANPAAFDKLKLEPSGTGPYKLVEYLPESLVKLERRTDYWDDTYGGPDTIEIKIITDDVTRLNALRSGDVDLADISGAQQAEAESAGFTAAALPTLTFILMYINQTKSEFGDLRVRQAIEHAIDREAYLDAVYGGAGVPTVQNFPESYYAYNPDYPADFYEFDPAKSKALLAEAGLADGFEFTMLLPAGPEYQLGAQVLQQMLADVGITMNLQVEDITKLFQIMFLDQGADTLLAQATGRADSQQQLDLLYKEKSVANPGGVSTPKYGELSAAAGAEVDFDKRAEAIRAMGGEAVEQAFNIPIGHLFLVRAHSDKVRGYDILQFGEPNYRNISVTD